MERVKIDIYISDLLYQYDCVIVPDFGGFVTNVASAKIKSAQNRFIPPSKTLSFNRNLKVNDGLLANHIAGRKSINYQQAIELIKSFVHASENNLNEGGKVVIEKVGTLYTDAEKNICFSPDTTINYLRESFGLESFKKTPLKRSKSNLIPEREDEQESKKKAIPWKAAAAIFIGLLGGSWLAFNYQSSNNSFLNYSSLNFLSAVPAKYSPKAKNVVFEREMNVQSSWIDSEGELSELVLVEELAKANHIFVKEPITKDPVASNDNTKVNNAALSEKLRYHVVGGCFSIYENAEGFFKTITDKGFNAKMIGKFNDLHAVSYSSFATREEALDLLAQVKRNENSKAWLLIK